MNNISNHHIKDDREKCAPGTLARVIAMENQIAAMRAHIDALESDGKRLRREADRLREDLHTQGNATQRMIYEATVPLTDEIAQQKETITGLHTYATWLITLIRKAGGDDCLEYEIAVESATMGGILPVSNETPPATE